MIWIFEVDDNRFEAHTIPTEKKLEVLVSNARLVALVQLTGDYDDK